METVEGAPFALVAIAVGGLVLGALPLLWILRRLGRTVLRRDQLAVGMSRYMSALVTGCFLLGIGLAATGLLITLRGYHAFTKRTRVAEVQCIELGGAKLRLYYVPIDSDGQRGATETYDLEGDEWTVGGEVLRFRPFMTVLGVNTIHKVTRVEGKWSRAADANGHKVTAFDIGGGESTKWLALYRDGTRGPLSFVIAGAHGGAVSQLPDRRAVFEISVTDDGYIVDKRSL